MMLRAHLDLILLPPSPLGGRLCQQKSQRSAHLLLLRTLRKEEDSNAVVHFFGRGKYERGRPSPFNTWLLPRRSHEQCGRRPDA